MDPEYWKSRWQDGRIGFHEANANAWLVEHAPGLLDGGEAPGANGAPRGGAARRVFVPLCGKSHDLAHLAALGGDVVGVDVSDLAARAFFDERGLEADVRREGAFVAHRARVPGPSGRPAGEVTVLVGDFFDLDVASTGRFAAFYDRAALIAIGPSEQARYVGKLLELAEPGARILLVTFAYEGAAVDGPPWSVDGARVRELFASRCAVGALGERDVLAESAKLRDAGATRVTEAAWLLTVRG